MKPSKIFDILNLAQRARDNNKVFNPLFVGPPGLGKSEIVQAWCKQQGVPFIDLRLAYMESPDLIGFPSISVVNGRQVTTHNTPEFWPQDPEWEGVVLFEEPNRASTSVMNCMMQILTDRKVHTYTLPKKAILVGRINPEGELYDTNSMDSALKDRFETFTISYDKDAFVSYMKDAEWDKDIKLFVESGMYSYLAPEEVKAPGAKYVSPRTMSKLNAVMKASFDSDDELMLFTTILGPNIGKDFYNFRHNESPVTVHDLLTNLEGSLMKLRKFADPANFKSGVIGITLKDIVERGDIEDALLVEVIKAIPTDQATSLIRDLEYKRKDNELLKRICNKFPEIKEQFRQVIRHGK